MAKQLTTVTVDGRRYSINPYNARYGLRLATDLALLIGEPLLRLIFSMKDAMSAGKSALDADIDLNQAAVSLLGFTAKLNGKVVEDLFDRILDQTMPENSSTSVVKDMDTRFMGDYLHLCKLVVKTVEVQFSDFFDAIGGLGGLVALARSQSPTASNGKSGD